MARICGVLTILTAINMLLLHAASADTLPNTQAPAGFSLTSVAEDLAAPTTAQFTPDGRIFVAEKDGIVKIVKNGQVLGQPFYQVPAINTYGDRGLLGLALDPNFATNGYVYLLYTHDNNPSAPSAPKTARLVRITANGDVAVPGSEQVLLGKVAGTPAQSSCQNQPANSDCLPADGLSHGADTVAFGPDGKLYISIGESADYLNVDPLAFRTQDINSLAGKILRINPDGTGPADNPYFSGNPNDNRSKVYAYGFRNPFRLSLRPSDGLVMVGDVGWSGWEEINAIKPGANYGWPCYEGNEQQNGAGASTGKYKDQAACKQMYQSPPANLAFPIHTYPHPPSSSITGGVFYTGEAYPAEYKNRYFYGDFVRNQISSMALTSQNTVVSGSNKVFASNTAGPVGFFTGPGGDLYFIAINRGAIYHVTYSTANQKPIAVASADKIAGPTPLTVNFTSSGSADPENDDLTFRWDFGDGSQASEEPNPTHTFANNGVYTTTLTVTDAFNNVATKTLVIHAGQTAPTLDISTPANITVAAPNQVVNFASSATDALDGTIAADKLHWQVTIQHCPLDSCHAHTLLNTTGANGSFTFPAHDGPYYLQISLSATNSLGLTTTKAVTVYPQGQKITHGLQLDGINDYAVTSNTQGLKLQEFTAEAMIKTLTTDDDGAEVMSMGNNWMLRLFPSGVLHFTYNSNGTWQYVTAESTKVVDGLWHHVAVTRTATTIKLYIDGALKAQADNANPINYAYGNDFLIGRHGAENDRYNFNGTIDEVRLWATPRSDTDIARYHSTSLPGGGTAGLVAYYKIEEGSGSLTADSSPSQAHGLVLVNGVNWTAGAPLSDPPASQAVTQLQDTFTGATLDTNKWQIIGSAARVTQNGTLAITAPTVGTGYHGVGSKARYELKDSAIFVEAPQTTSGAGTETHMILELDSKNRLYIGRTNNSLQLRHRVNGVNSDANIPYDTTAMRWWRIREAAGTVYLETSPDSATWTTRRTFTKAFDLSQLRVILQAGTYIIVSQPGVAAFDNLNLAQTAPTPTPGYSLALDGQTGKASVNSGGLYNTQDFTIETWAKVQATALKGAELISNNNDYGLRVRADGKLVFFTRTSSTLWQQHITSNLNLKDNTWHHIAVTKAGTAIKVYVDGVLQGTFTALSPVTYTPGGNFVLGQHGKNDPDFTLTGQLDEVRIWSIARTPEQIQTSWNKQLTAPQTGLLGYWQLNESSGTTAADTSGNNRTLTLSTGASHGAGFPQ